MNEDQEKLDALLKRAMQPGGEPLSSAEQQWLEEFSSRYPFFTLPDAMKAPKGDENATLREITSGTPESAARMRGIEGASRFDGFYPPADTPKAPSTNDAIDDFLNTYGHQSPEEDELLERLIFNPVPDYAQQLARQEESELPAAADSGGDSPQERLNRFILSQRGSGETSGSRPAPSVAPEGQAVLPETSPSAATSAETSSGTVAPAGTSGSNRHRTNAQRPAPTTPGAAAAPPEGLLSESLAKIYIKTRRYEQAYEILNGLSLRFPEKSAYFADQLRFLRKLIINQQRLRLENEK